VEDVKALQRTRDQLAEQVDERLLQIYERMSRRFVRVIVPVEGRICSGCRMGLPTSDPTKQYDSATCDLCENCGRILYRR
jgi:predicted  nucleic acid-binding Zn-ribbon protein